MPTNNLAHPENNTAPEQTVWTPPALRETAEKVALQAGEYLREVFRRSMHVEHKKNRHDLVTEHDRAVEDLIVASLLTLNPQWRIVGEEAGTRGGSSDVTWFIDPIDGTSNFAQGIAFFCVAIGVEEHGKLTAGVVYDPIADNLFSADDSAAYLNGRRLITPPTQPDGDATIITGYPSANDLDIDGPLALRDLGELIAAFSSLRRTGSGALTLAHVAAGWTDSAFGGSVNPWDVAGASLILTQAGGNYQPLWMEQTPNGREAHHAPAFVAAGPNANYPSLDTFVKRITQRRAPLTAQ